MLQAIGTFAAALAVVTVPASSSAWTAQKPAVQAAVLRTEPKAKISSILVKREFALVSGPGTHVALQKTNGTWRIVCHLPTGGVSAETLEGQCGIPAVDARHLAADEPINAMANSGQFTAAASAEESLVSTATPDMSETERARMQELHLLKKRLELQQITRAQAIQQWNQLQYSWALP